MLDTADSMGAAENVSGLYVRFSKIPREDVDASDKAGHPVFVDIDYITIVVPGDKSSEVCRPATPDDKSRFRAAWDRYVAGQGEAVSGTPLKEWPGVTRSQVEELAYFKIYSMEQLASVDDANLRNLGAGYLALRARARAYLERIREEAPLEKMRAEIQRRDEQLAQLQAQMDGLLRQSAAEESSPRARRQRKSNPAEVGDSLDVRPLRDGEELG